MRRLLAASMAFVTLTGAGCAASMSVSSHVDRDLDFSQYRTYTWGPADALPAGDSRLDANPVFADNVHGAVNRELAMRGLTMVVSSGTPDLLIHYHATVANRIDVNQVDRGYGYCQTTDCPPDVIEYEAGTIVIDLIDARTKRLIWRGWAQSRLEAFLEDPERMSETVQRAVATMMRRLPSDLKQ